VIFLVICLLVGVAILMVGALSDTGASSDERYPTNPARYDMWNINNLNGYTNPGSPNYVGRHHRPR
jgi:hypothetical protein